MSLTELLNRPCTLLIRTESGVEDDFSNQGPTVNELATVCYVEQRRRLEPETEGEVSEGDWLGVFPRGTDLTTADAVRVDGLGTFELIGAPWPTMNPRTQTEWQVETTMRLTRGALDLP